MCDENAAKPPQYTRRQVLHGAGGLTLAAMLPTARAAAQPTTGRLQLADLPNGLTVAKNAMHVHASGSEMTASMSLQLSQASAWGYDAVWWTEHGWRMLAEGYRQFIGFSANPDVENRHPIHFLPVTSGTLAQSGGGVVATPPSPLDPAGGALRAYAQGAGRSAAASRFLLSNQSSVTGSRLMMLQRGYVGRVQLVLEITPTALGNGSYLEVLVDLSDHPSPAGRRHHQLSYRFAKTPAAPYATGGRGVVTIAATPGQRSTVTLNPVADIAVLWPGLHAHDMSLLDITLGAVSRNRGMCDGQFESLRFAWAPVTRGREIQAHLIDAYRADYPQISQFAAAELSWLSPHVNRFGGDPSIQDCALGALPDDYYPAAVAQIHNTGGAASWNHPFGSDHAPMGTPNQQVARRRDVFGRLMATGLYGADVLEVGYANRGGANLRMHLDLWDTLLRNGVLLTGSGVNDDHTGTNWGLNRNGFYTGTVSVDTAESSLVSALVAGRAFFAHTGLAPQVSLDLVLDDGTVMGQVSTSQSSQRTVSIMAAGLPAGSGVRVVQGFTDYAGTGSPDPLVQTLGTVLPANSFSTGSRQVGFSGTQGTYIRVEVVSSDGTTVVAGSNPVFVLPGPPPASAPPIVPQRLSSAG